MTNRIIDISESGCFLRVQDRQLKIERKNADPASIPLDDIAILIAGSSWMTLTQPVLAELAEVGASLIITDKRNLPIALSLPLFGHSLQAQKLRIQIAARPTALKQLWREIVAAKIKNQAAALIKLHNTDDGLLPLAKRVRSGDSDNVEAQAARKYWPLLFKSETFRREPQNGTPPNNFLDYGYAVLRAILARAICASGMNPTLGLHHAHRDNSFALADDLMEPFRPIVDVAAFELVRDGLEQTPLDRTIKGRLIHPLMGTYLCGGEHRSLFDIGGKLAACLLRRLEGLDEALPLPDALWT